MKNLIIISLVFLVSCSPKNYTFMGKKCTKRQHDRRLEKYTKKFIEDNMDLLEKTGMFEIVYDTTQKKDQIKRRPTQ